jgi:chromosome segregation ATPase
MNNKANSLYNGHAEQSLALKKQIKGVRRDLERAHEIEQDLTNKYNDLDGKLAGLQIELDQVPPQDLTQLPNLEEYELQARTLEEEEAHLENNYNELDRMSYILYEAQRIVGSKGKLEQLLPNLQKDNVSSSKNLDDAQKTKIKLQQKIQSLEQL